MWSTLLDRLRPSHDDNVSLATIQHHSFSTHHWYTAPSFFFHPWVPLHYMNSSLRLLQSYFSYCLLNIIFICQLSLVKTLFMPSLNFSSVQLHLHHLSGLQTDLCACADAPRPGYFLVNLQQNQWMRRWVLFVQDTSASHSVDWSPCSLFHWADQALEPCMVHWLSGHLLLETRVVLAALFPGIRYRCFSYCCLCWHQIHMYPHEVGQYQFDPLELQLILAPVPDHLMSDPLSHVFQSGMGMGSALWPVYSWGPQWWRPMVPHLHPGDPPAPYRFLLRDSWSFSTWSWP